MGFGVLIVALVQMLISMTAMNRTTNQEMMRGAKFLAILNIFLFSYLRTVNALRSYSRSGSRDLLIKLQIRTP